MKICLFLGALLTVAPFLRAQNSSFPDLSGLLRARQNTSSIRLTNRSG